MAVVLPDLFGAALDGQRQAVSDNYNNMRSERSIIGADIANQSNELNLMKGLETYQDGIDVSAANAQKARLAAEQLALGQTGMLDRITTDNIMSGARAQAAVNNTPGIYANFDGTLNANIAAGNAANAQATGAAGVTMSMIPQYTQALADGRQAQYITAGAAPAMAQQAIQYNTAANDLNLAGVQAGLDQAANSRAMMPAIQARNNAIVQSQANFMPEQTQLSELRTNLSNQSAALADQITIAYNNLQQTTDPATRLSLGQTIEALQQNRRALAEQYQQAEAQVNSLMRPQ